MLRVRRISPPAFHHSHRPERFRLRPKSVTPGSTVAAGTTVTFNVIAAGFTNPTYSFLAIRWRRNGHQRQHQLVRLLCLDAAVKRPRHAQHHHFNLRHVRQCRQHRRADYGQAHISRSER